MSSWKNLPPISKFSIIAFAVALIFGLMSLGKAGIALHYAVNFALPPTTTTFQSKLIGGMTWSVGFLMAGMICNKINSNSNSSKLVIGIIYLLILWLWDYMVWLAVAKMLLPY